MKPDTEDKKEEPKRQRLSINATLLTLIWAGAYMLVYAYERGYAQYFHIPLELIDITITRLLIAGVTAVTLLFIFAVAISSIWKYILRTTTDIAQQALSLLFAALIGLVIVAAFFRGDIAAWIFLASVIAIAVGRYLLLPLLPHAYRQMSYKEKLHKYWEKHSEHSETLHRETFSYAIEQIFGPASSTMFLYFAFLVLILVPNAGEYEAAHKRIFYVLNDRPNEVVLRMYGSTVVAAMIDRDSRTVTPNLYILSIENAPLVLHEELIGPLKVSEKQVKGG